MMQDAIKGFAKQFAFEPTVEQSEKLENKTHVILVGMGGSHLAADIARTIDPGLPLLVHTDYGLPTVSDEALKQSLIVCSSYSGNTEEVLSAYDEAKERGLSVAVSAVGGKLIEQAKEDGIPFVQMPDTGIQPRSALGFSLLALFKLMGRNDLLDQARGLVDILRPEDLEEEGQRLAQLFKDHVPVIYASARNVSVAYNWKIKFNETGKIPAFYNVFPELNHNEMTGFDAQDSSKHLSEGIFFLFLKDIDDHPKVQVRMDVLEKLYKERGLPVEVMDLAGQNIFEKIFRSLIIADWAAVHTAEIYGLESEQVPMVEEFKKLV
ncbi:MAG: SIS domain-containing protein [Candidatus Magasanikbacteria bacterium]